MSDTPGRDRPAAGASPAVDRYLSLLKRCLTRTLFPDGTHDWLLTRIDPADPALRAVGHDWPTEAVTMVGLARLDQLQASIETVLAEGIPGDLMETGVWRGGCGIFMRAVLEASGDPDRLVWLADSFQGLPAPAADFPQDAGDRQHTLTRYLGVSQAEVEANFRRFDLLDDRVRFVPGWFRDTLPHAPVDRLAVLRLDGDMYESTWVALEALYPKVSSGGIVIIDDYGALPGCRDAVETYRTQHTITTPLEWIDWTGVTWRKEGRP